MSDAVISALITAAVSLFIGALTFVGVLISNGRANRDIQAKLEKNQAVSDTKIDNLTHEVRAHNDFATRIPVCEAEIKELKSDIKILRQTINQYHIHN